MTSLNPAALEAFAKPFAAAGKLSRVKFAHRKGRLDLEIAVRLRGKRFQLRFSDVEECRFQKRTGQSIAKFPRITFAFLDGLYFAAFDDLSLLPRERPAIHDFRGSEAYVASTGLAWAEVPLRTA
jgi:hypothetical protein